MDSDDDDVINKNKKPVTIKRRLRDSYYVLLCLDLDMTLVDDKCKPFVSVSWFGRMVRNIHPKMYIVINTMASEEHAEYALPGTGINYDILCADVEYGKAISMLRRRIPDIKYLNGPTVLVDDKSFNLKGHYDVEVNVSKYFIRNSKHRIVDINYKSVLTDIIIGLENFWDKKQL